jgi:Mrp family chromosome partitioning ATPase
MTDFMKTIQEHFDVVIYDSAPILPVTDSVILAPKADGLLLVVKHASTDKRDLEHIVETLEKTNTKIIGVVMNQVISSRGYGYYYSYYNKPYYSNS